MLSIYSAMLSEYNTYLCVRRKPDLFESQQDLKDESTIPLFSVICTVNYCNGAEDQSLSPC